MLSSAYIMMTECNFSTFPDVWDCHIGLMIWYRWPKNHQQIYNLAEMAKSYCLLTMSSIHILSAFSVMHTHTYTHSECEWVFNPQIYDFRIVSLSLSFLLLLLFVVGCYCCCLFVFRLHYFKNAKYPSLRWIVTGSQKWRRDNNKKMYKKKPPHIHLQRHQAHFRKS